MNEDPFELREPLETERLVLRPFGSGDLDALFSYRSRADVAQYLMWEPEDHEQVEASLDRKLLSTRFDAEGDVLALAIELRATGDLIGDVILAFVSQEHRVAEIGYIVHPDHHGHGYATEACRAILRLAFEELGIHRVIGSLEAGNVASARVLEKLGMRREAHFVENEFVKGEWQSELVYAILEREWLSPEG
jgi:RimJ/RimL family protein N-acetyltransferase